MRLKVIKIRKQTIKIVIIDPSTQQTGIPTKKAE